MKERSGDVDGSYRTEGAVESCGAFLLNAEERQNNREPEPLDLFQLILILVLQSNAKANWLPIRHFISAKHILCPSYRRTRTIPRFTLFDIGFGIHSGPPNAEGLSFAHRTILAISGQRSDPAVR